MKTQLIQGNSRTDNPEPSLLTHKQEGPTTSRKTYTQVSGNAEAPDRSMI